MSKELKSPEADIAEQIQEDFIFAIFYFSKLDDLIEAHWFPFMSFFLVFYSLDEDVLPINYVNTFSFYLRFSIE